MTGDGEEVAPRASNLDHWEKLARFHGTGDDGYYDLDALRAGETLMGEEERAALDRATTGAGLDGADVLHLQCHIGCDSISMAREGARVTAVDFSATALARARALATQCGVVLDTVEADATRLPHDLDGRFDYVYSTIGVLCWIDDVDAWMAGVARALRPGGALVLVELHPVTTMVESLDPLVLDFPYAFDGPHVWSGTGTYANRDADVEWTTVQYAHSVGEVVSAAIGAGLVVEHLQEHLSGSFNTGQFDGPEDDGRYRLRLGVGGEEAARCADDAHADDARAPGYPLPVLYTLLARAPR